ncbi:STE/STE11/cdc15 protein kinase [Coprinopsis cinerea okayama7|uniref:non-specific serine/threonine protein kinase n=1 Tax=Coprinopsis cinerea (strain Okayama-7 / 130 / ATCC MYA-4618 / FGSC 9003) TaxID=240176 RepID=A8NSH8_COPC7|nr:STE/STE11/cdc15 protein kinase [Coprinopsis cinerea okayama7\|eukprot:XP_001836015.2 STE/STE11/cdc15 protein kinase [Coprinopsis cinerea okayama7\
MSTPSRPSSMPAAKPGGSKSLSGYQLGDSLGKGAFGQVYRALNWETGETVAVKEIQLSNIPKGELPEIMSEIDLLKNLNHENIVKYKGFVKTREFLYIILEFCENGSLHNIIKKFGKFPENLVAVYISQVLEGLVYLHDQGVIHRDIKGANILTNKDGTVKLADFGVAARTGGVVDGAVVGSPYWMAPEVIEQSGATTASDIWSVGCVVIELLEGRPPYHNLDPMPALFRIVQDDCPPIPEGASAIVKDFLYHCFQKDCNLRISAKKLLKHPWMVATRKQMNAGKAQSGEQAGDNASGSQGTRRPLSNYNYDEAVLKVQEWNEALKSPTRPSKQPSRYTRPHSPLQRHSELHSSSSSTSLSSHTPGALGWKGGMSGNPKLGTLVEKIQPHAFVLQPPEEQTDNWDDDFEGGISFTKLQALEKSTHEEDKSEPNEDNAQTIRPTKSPGAKTVPLAQPPAASIAPIVEDYSDLALDEDEGWLEEKVADFKNQAEFGKYTEDDDDDDYDDVFGKPNSNIATGMSMQTLQLNTRLSSKSWLGDDGDEEDPFAEIDEGFDEDDLESNLQRDKHARLCNAVNQLIDELTPSAPDFQLRDACDQLLKIIIEAPEMQGQLVSSHGMLAILEVLEGRCSRDVIMKLLQIINVLVTEDVGFLESFCLIGGIPVMMEFTSKKYPSECRLEASNFIRLLCHTSVLTLQMFISCRGLKVLVDLLDEDYGEQTELVEHALNGIGSVFELQSPTTKNDFCRMFIREGLLDPLSAALLNVMSNHEPASVDKSTKMKVIQILLVFCQVSQSDIHVRNALGTRKVIRRLLRACELLDPECLVQMLKAVKHLSMNATLHEVLQNANALEILIRILEEQSSGPHSTEMANHIFQTCYNLCRLSKSRQEEAAQAGIIPCLKRVIETSSPLKQFALPILCDLASAGKSCRTLLWQHDGIGMYIRLLDDPYFQVSAVESVLSWLQDETARVEDQLLKPYAVEALLKCFVNAKANSFENLLDPFLKILRLSHTLTIALTKSSAFFKRIVDRLGHNSKAVVRLNLLRILRYVCEIHPNRTVLVERYGLLGIVEKLSRSGGDGAVLVKELAREIVPTLRPALKPAGLGSSGSSHHGGGHGTGERDRDREHYLGGYRERGGVYESRLRRSPPSGLGHGSSISSSYENSLAMTPGSHSKGLIPKRARRSASEASGVVPSSPSTGGFGIPKVSRSSSRQRLGEIPWQPTTPPNSSSMNRNNQDRTPTANRW